MNPGRFFTHVCGLSWNGAMPGYAAQSWLSPVGERTLVVLALLILAAPLQAANIHIVWDPSVTEGYCRIKSGFVDLSQAKLSREDLAKRRSEDFTADLPDGHYRLEGPGFSAVFQSLDGKIIFRNHGIDPVVNDDQGRITFNTATLKLDLNGYEQSVVLKDLTPVLDKATRIHTLKVLCGQQKLDYGGGMLTVAIDAKETSVFRTTLVALSWKTTRSFCNPGNTPLYPLPM
jgi:hypothetical protein